ncbi:MAG: UDP-N-acetylmuramoyl-tripeptide--D-alanyl-D-alanine ligase [Bacteroidota bacterium]|nr:UDP-N-acetylmuramoyl-tripeptide--D-alanyl-D-alanine ligase [Bacteroidota bacterium]
MLKVDDLISVRHKAKINFDKLKKKKFHGVSIDSRTIKKNEIFFAIKGERTDGHNFLDDVFKRRVIIAVVNEDWFSKVGKRYSDKIFFIVEDTTLALGEFSKIHRSNFNFPVLCIGGSNGKTTTKDLTAAVLSQKFKVLKTEGNFNNHIGLPLTLLRLNEYHNFCLLEVGCNHFNEIKYLCGIAEPDYGMVTNIGKEHLEFFKDLTGVAKAEFELFEYLKSRKQATIFFNLDDRFIKKYSAKISYEKKFTYSYKFDTDVKGRFKGYNKNFEPEIEISYREKEFKTFISTFGKHSIYNGLAAAAAGLFFKVSQSKIKKALQNFKPSSSKRMEALKVNSMTIINDTYNSNPESVKMGLETMLDYKTKGEKYAVLSDMLELGKLSKSEHSNIGKLVKKLKVKNLYTYGKESYNTFYNAGKLKNNFYFDSKEDLIRMLKKNLKPDDVIYVKGSRGMKMEEVVTGITEN